MMMFLSNFLQEKNNNVTLYTLSYKKNIFSENKIIFKIKDYSKKNILKVISLVCIAFQIRNKDFIIIWNSPMHFAWVLSKILFFSKAKLIWWNHHYPWYYCNNTGFYILLKRYIEKCLVKKIDIVLSNSEFLKRELDNIWNINSQILHPVLDEGFINYKHINKTKNNIIFSYSRWEKGKNIEMIFKTYENLKNKILDLVLIIWWDWEELQYFTNKYKNNRNVKILWSLDTNQILYNLNISNLVLFPSKIDSFWLVKIESMSTWTPVVCFKYPKNKETVVQNWVNGFCTESEKDFIQKTYEILTDISLKKKLSKWSLETARGFTIKHFEKQLLNIFKL